jgi:hypothetical protein
MGPHLPVEVWLLVFDALNDRAFLWATLRNTSRLLRDFVDGYLRHGLSQNWLVDLHYNDFHMQEGPFTHDIHIPMVFDRFSKDGTRIFFQQHAYKYINSSYPKGSVRGWVPFIERYCAETRKPAPKVLNKSKPSTGPPLWEKMHAHWRNTLPDDVKTKYLSDLRHAIGIGRGDYPPYYLKIYNALNDSELVDLEIDCKRCEISFNWRETYTALVRESTMVRRAQASQRKPRVWDAELSACDARSPNHQHRKDRDYRIHARRKRLKPWVTKNKRRMSPEMRWTTENSVYAQHNYLRRVLRLQNLCEMEGPDADEPEEIVPARLADDHPDLLVWPWGDDNRYFVPKRSLCGSNGCIVS